MVDLSTKLRLGKTTLYSKYKHRQRLTSEESEKALRVARAAAKAEHVLGDSGRNWLLSPCRALKNELPIDVLDTALGLQDVLAVLTRLEFGVYT